MSGSLADDSASSYVSAKSYLVASSQAAKSSTSAAPHQVMPPCYMDRNSPARETKTVMSPENKRPPLHTAESGFARFGTLISPVGRGASAGERPHYVTVTLSAMGMTARLP